MDVNPRFESFWIVGGLHPPKSVRYKRYHVSWIDDKEEINSPIDRYYQTICMLM